jgi:hypothetical protein
LDRSNCLSGAGFQIVGLVSDHCIEDCEEFSGAGCYGEFDGFSGDLEPGSEGFEAGVVAGGDECREIESAPDFGASAPDPPFAAVLPRLAGMRREAGEAGDLAAVERSKFRQAGQHRRPECRADAGHRTEALAGLCQGFTAGNQSLDLALDLLQVILQHLQKASDFCADPFVLRLLGAVLLGPDHGHKIAPAGDQIGQTDTVRFGWRGRSEVQRPAHLRQNLRIQLVRFGQLSGGAGKVTGLTRIDTGIGYSSLIKRLGQRTGISPGGFEHHESPRRHLGKARKRLLCRHNPRVLARGQGVNVDPIFGNIDADEIMWHSHGACP